MSVSRIGKGFTRSNLLSIKMGGRRTILDVVITFRLVSPKLRLRFVNESLDTNRITRQAKRTTYRLCRQRQSLRATKSVKLTEITVGNEVVNRMAQIIKKLF